MIFVNYGAGGYSLLDHAPWNGLHLVSVWVELFGKELLELWFLVSSEGRDVYLKSISIWKVFSSNFFWCICICICLLKKGAFKYKYILFQIIKFIWSSFLTS
jgi:hypothetical protein